MISVTIFIVLILIITIYLFVEFQRFKHRLFAIVLIGLVLFAYFSMVIAFRNYDFDYKSIPGLVDGSKVYWNWVLSIGGNLVKITTNAVHMDWKISGNLTS